MQTEATLSNAWDQHLASEFAAKSPEQALATMTAAPYVNVVALMIGARGRDDGRDCSAHHCLSHIPPDMETVPVSRTIGQGRVVDELIRRFTHAIRLDWLLPGLAPTGTRVAVPLVAIVPCAGDKVAHEPIDWETRRRYSSWSASSIARCPCAAAQSRRTCSTPRNRCTSASVGR